MIARLKKLAFSLLPERQKQKIWLDKVGAERMHFNYSFGLQPSFVVSRGNKTWTARSSAADGHEPGVVKWIADNRSKTDVFFDVGASFGFFTALTAQLSPRADIHSFEPSMYFRTWLNENLRPVPTAQRHLIKKFAGASNGPQTITLDHYTSSTGKVPGLVKMDVDGAETEVLKGSEKLLGNGHTCWLIEVHPTDLPSFHSDVDQLLALVPETMGIRYLYGLRSGLQPWQDQRAAEEHEDFFVCLFPANKRNEIHW